jgi:hypothetical protein
MIDTNKHCSGWHWVKLLQISLIALFLSISCAMYAQEINQQYIKEKTRSFLKKFTTDSTYKWYAKQTTRNIKIDTIIFDENLGQISIYLSNNFCYIPFRQEIIDKIYNDLKAELGEKAKNYKITLFTLKQPIEQLIPNLYRENSGDYDKNRITQLPKGKKSQPRPLPLVKNLSKPYIAGKGLDDRHIALWHSHGWYYENKLDRWEWQRARLFQTVEDKYTMSIVLPYLVPMLENAGANVLLPRERDPQTEMLIADNDLNLRNAEYLEEINGKEKWQTAKESGYKHVDTLTNGTNPFQNGTFRFIKASKTETAKAIWKPNFTKSGEYAVYISYGKVKNAANDVHYTVFHAGGKTEFTVNQQIGTGTWVYLGTFLFNQGENNRLEMSNKSAKGKFVSADAVRFGGGMGNVARNGKLSERPRYLEGARYYLQFAGIPDTLVYSLTKGKDDYRDDYQSRGEWVNYLKGAPAGPTRKPDLPGLGIPIDLSLAIHTDAGVTTNDTTIGTLSIYSSQYGKNEFPDGMSKLASRDLADILQTEIVNDIRRKWDPKWNRRQLWDKDYSEAWRPNVPATLLELFSHQNLLDMKFGTDPRFRFDMARSIYKGILKFIATQNHLPYIVQPLPVTYFQAIFTENNSVSLKWKAQTDSLEPTAKADKFIVYTRIENGGFDNGIVVSSPSAIIKNIEKGKIYRFKVTAVNDGGESFPSEILSVCLNDTTRKPVMIISGFTRTCGPEAFETEEYAGFADFLDHGVADKQNIGFIGKQYEFRAKDEWRDDDDPGFGSSYGNDETKIIVGNSFDYPYVHGQSIRKAGYSFVSASKSAVNDSLVDLSAYRVVDIILGEERETKAIRKDFASEFKAFPAGFQKMLRKYAQNGGNLFVSGAYTGRDLFEKKMKDDADVKFAQEVLKIKWRTSHASRSGKVKVSNGMVSKNIPPFWFNSEYNPDNLVDSTNYQVEAPDGIEPADSTSKTVLRYAENNISAGVLHQGKNKVLVWGFPFETLISADVRDKWMKLILDSLLN